MDPIINSDGTVTDAAPVDGGQGASGEVSEQTPNFGGFKTVEELAADHAAQVERATRLESLKGKLGNELGTLKAQLAQAEGRIQGLTEAQKAAMVTKESNLNEIDAQYNKGEITWIDYMSKRDAIRDATLISQTEKKVKEEIGGFKSELERQRNIETFLAAPENAGYVEAFKSGKLDPWFDKGMGGEDAWTQYKLQQTGSEVGTYRKQVEDLTKELTTLKAQLGGKLEQGKAGAGRVIGDQGGGASFAQGGAKGMPLKSHAERVAAASALVRNIQ
jgi:hypothetical protein